MASGDFDYTFPADDTTGEDILNAAGGQQVGSYLNGVTTPTPAAAPASSDPFSPLIAGYKTQLSSAQTEEKSALDKLYNNDDMPGMRPGDALAGALMGLLPIALGAAQYGLSGAAVGAKAGAEGTKPYFTQAEADQQKRDTLEKLQYTAAHENKVQAAKDLSQTQAQDAQSQATEERQKEMISARGQELHDEIARGDKKDPNKPTGAAAQGITDPVGVSAFNKLAQGKWGDASDEEKAYVAAHPRQFTLAEQVNESGRKTVSDQHKEEGKHTLSDATVTGTADIHAIRTSTAASMKDLQVATEKEGADSFSRTLNALVPGTDTYNAVSNLKIAGARAAKAMEGRVNETTLALYTDIVTPKVTDTVASYSSRVSSFIQQIDDQVNTRVGALSAAGKNTGTLGNFLNPNAGSDSFDAIKQRLDAIRAAKQNGSEKPQ